MTTAIAAIEEPEKQTKRGGAKPFEITLKDTKPYDLW